MSAIRRECLRDRADELAVTERLEIERVGRRRGPESQRVDGFAAMAHHGPIERKADQRGWPIGDRLQRALRTRTNNSA